jgi:hypothetical protein
MNEPLGQCWPGSGAPDGVPEEPTRLQTYAALAALDHGSGIFAYGCISSGGIYGRQGLEHDEYMAWKQLKAFVEGWLQATDNAESDELLAAVKAEWERVENAKPSVAESTG